MTQPGSAALGSHEIGVRVYYEDTDALCFSLTGTAVKFTKPALFDDELVVQTTVTSISGARVGFKQDIYRGSVAGELICAGECEAACLDVNTLRPRRMPADLFDTQR